MRQVEGHRLWIGSRGDVRDVQATLRMGIEALVDLAIDEAPVVVGREVVSCRFPLLDGAGNEEGLVRAAVETVAGLVRAGVPTLVFCSAGMSRSPAVCAGALTLVTGRGGAECLEIVVKGGARDVSAGMWGAVLGAVEEARIQTKQMP